MLNSFLPIGYSCLEKIFEYYIQCELKILTEPFVVIFFTCYLHIIVHKKANVQIFKAFPLAPLLKGADFNLYMFN